MKAINLLLITQLTVLAASIDEACYTYTQSQLQARLHNRFFSELYSIVKPIIGSLQENIGEFSEYLADEYLCTHAHQDETVSVRLAPADEICPEEKKYLQARLPLVKKGCTKLVSRDIPDTKIPRIALCCSGGGHRAMLFTFGFLKGLQETGLLDCTTYMAGLSGSTWALAGWIASKKKLSEYIAGLPQKLYQGLEGVKNPKLLYELSKQLLTKVMHGQFISLIDIYGPTLANTLLTDFDMNRLNITLSESHAYLSDGSLPLPIYTAVTPNIEPYEWIEFTPFEAGSSYQKAYVPTWAYGRKFKNGTSTNYAGEQSLGYMMGVFGSAFEFAFEDAVRQTSQSINAHIASLPATVQPIMHTLIENLIDSPLDSVRLAPSSLPNFTYKTATCNLKDDKNLTLVDAGMYFNLPFPPLLRTERDIDIIIVADASADIAGCQTLRWAEEYMHLKGLKFPPIDYANADKQVMTIFRSKQDASCPIVIYFPCLKNNAYSKTFDPAQCIKEDFCNTINFTYNSNQIGLLIGLGEYAIKQHFNEIITIMLDVIEKKA